MKNTDFSVRQGDVLLFNLSAVAEKFNTDLAGAAKMFNADLSSMTTIMSPDADKGHIVAHSETGHDHALNSDTGTITLTREVTKPNDTEVDIDLKDMLAIIDNTARLDHYRDNHKHETVALGSGTWLVRPQRVAGTVIEGVQKARKAAD
tara:strand:+ start:44 stop:490 length:447 start_codon:yes stop_codon:yes gene_type:complete